MFFISVSSHFRCIKYYFWLYFVTLSSGFKVTKKDSKRQVKISNYTTLSQWIFEFHNSQKSKQYRFSFTQKSTILLFQNIFLSFSAIITFQSAICDTESSSSISVPSPTLYTFAAIANTHNQSIFLPPNSVFSLCWFSFFEFIY